MDGLVACLKGINGEEREKITESLGEEKAAIVKAELAKMDRAVVEPVDLKNDPKPELIKEMQQVMKEISSQRYLKKLGVNSGMIEPLEWRAFIIKISAMFSTLKACFSITVRGKVLCALERDSWDKLAETTEKQWEEHFNSFAPCHLAIVDRCRSIFIGFLSDQVIIKYAGMKRNAPVILMRLVNEFESRNTEHLIELEHTFSNLKAANYGTPSELLIAMENLHTEFEAFETQKQDKVWFLKLCSSFERENGGSEDMQVTRMLCETKIPGRIWTFKSGLAAFRSAISKSGNRFGNSMAATSVPTVNPAIGSIREMATMMSEMRATVAKFKAYTNGTGGGGGGGGTRHGTDSKSPCKNFNIDGKCDFGDRCRFSHDPALWAARGTCNYFTKTGRCKHGTRCKFKHVPANSPNATAAGMSAQWNAGSVCAPCHVNSTNCTKNVTNECVIKNVRSSGLIENCWTGIMDTGAEVSVSGSREAMHDMIRLDVPMCLLCADGIAKHVVREKGKIKLSCGTTLSNVYYCPEWLSHNYVSIHALCKDGYMIVIDGDTMSVVHKSTGKTMTDMQAKGRSWNIAGQSVHHKHGTISEQARLLNVNNKLMAKHRAYGHPSNKTLLELIKCTDDHGLTDNEISAINDLPRCHECDQAQMPKHSGAKKLRHKHAYIPNRIIMNSDLSGKKSMSIRGFRYFALCVLYKHDGTSMKTRYLMCDLLKNKNDLSRALEKRIRLVNNVQSGEGIAMFTSDNGGEFTSEHTQRVLAEHGIIFNPSAPECQFQNGAVERYMGIVKQLVIKMFIRCNKGNMPLVCWCYAVEHAVHLLNMRMAYNGMSMHESFYGTRLSNKYTLEFGQVVLCKATRAHAELGGWSLNKNAFWGKLLGFDPHRPNKFTVVAKNHRVYVVNAVKAYPNMFSFASLFRRCPSILDAPVQWDAARSEGESQPGGINKQNRPANPGSIPEGANGTEQNAPANGGRHQPNVSIGDTTPEKNVVAEPEQPHDVHMEMPEVETPEVDLLDVDNPPTDNVVAPVPVSLRRSSRRNAGQIPSNFMVDMTVREQFGELGQSKGSVGGIAQHASKPPPRAKHRQTPRGKHSVKRSARP
jgi:transposase InsO family protein